jgi:hypothetical protein
MQSLLHNFDSSCKILKNKFARDIQIPKKKQLVVYCQAFLLKKAIYKIIKNLLIRVGVCT